VSHNSHEKKNELKLVFFSAAPAQIALKTVVKNLE
jgi:hypothetical protein